MAEDLQSKAGELMKKVLTVGIGAIFLTEESVRKMVSEFKLPKELITGLLETANKTRKEFLHDFSNDIITRINETVDLKKALQEFLEKNEIDLKIKMTIQPKGTQKTSITRSED